MLSKIKFLFNGLPVVMYHSISFEQNSLSLSPTVFEEHCRAMQSAGWHTISLAQAEDYFLRQKPLPPKSAWITFDDGYLDNYTYAWPILRKYGLKGTTFAVLNKVEPGLDLRPTLENVWQGDLAANDLPRALNDPFVEHELGFKERHSLFLNWQEIRFLTEEGTMQIAPHSLDHAKVFVSPEFEGFFEPKERGRTFDRIKFEVPWGLPAFKAAPALANRAFLPSQKLLSAVKDLVPQTKKEAFAFFGEQAKRQQLLNLVRGFSPEELGRLETDAEMQERFKQEMDACQAIMRRELGAPSQTFCWPWGAYNKQSVAAAKNAGFKLLVTTEAGANWPGVPQKVCRFSVKQRSAAGVLFRFKLLKYNFIAALYSVFRFSGKPRKK